MPRQVALFGLRRKFDSSDGRSLIVIDAKTGVRLLDPKTGGFIRKLAVATPHEDDLFNPAYAISPDNNYWFMRQGNKILRYRLR